MGSKESHFSHMVEILSSLLLKATFERPLGTGHVLFSCQHVCFTFSDHHTALLQHPLTVLFSSFNALVVQRLLVAFRQEDTVQTNAGFI